MYDIYRDWREMEDASHLYLYVQVYIQKADRLSGVELILTTLYPCKLSHT